jgi:hypothetical protein
MQNRPLLTVTPLRLFLGQVSLGESQSYVLRTSWKTAVNPEPYWEIFDSLGE